MSIEAMNWTWTLNLPPTKKIILLSLADAADGEGVCWPRVTVIAKKCCTSERTVQRILKDLVSEGHLRVESRYRKDGSQASNTYYLSMGGTPDILSPPCVTVDAPPETSMSPPGDKGDMPPETSLSPHETTKNLQIETPQQPLLFPKQLSEENRKMIISMISGIPHSDSQSLLDELGCAISNRKIRSSVVGWFRSIVDSYRNGRFYPSLSQGSASGFSSVKNRRRLESRPCGDGNVSWLSNPEEYLKEMKRGLV